MDETQQTKSKKTFMEKVADLKGSLTIETVIALYIIPSFLSAVATQNMEYERACRINMGYSDEICDALIRKEIEKHPDEEIAIQKMLVDMQGWKMLLQCIIPAIVVQFSGTWSDRHGKRKPFILIPIVGEIFTAVGLLVCFYYKKASMEMIGFIDAFFPGLTGTWILMLMGLFSFIGDTTTQENRTRRIGAANFIFSLMIPIGFYLGGVLLEIIGFQGIFLLAILLNLMAISYGYMYITEVPMRRQVIKYSENALADFFDLRNIKDMFKTIFDFETSGKKIKIILLAIALMLINGPGYGETNVLFYYTRLKFNWGVMEYTNYNTIVALIGAFGLLFSLILFYFVMDSNDATVGFISCLSKCVSVFYLYFATDMVDFYIAPIAGIFFGTAIVVIRSMASKCVTSDKMGRINAFLCFVDAITPCIFSTLYVAVYKSTLSYSPEAVFLISVISITVASVIFFKMYLINKKEE